MKIELYDDVVADQITIGAATRRMRKIAGLTQPEYASLINVSPRVLMEIERGHANPTLNTLEKIAKPFGLQDWFR